MDNLPWPGPLAALAPLGAALAAQHGFTSRDGWMIFALVVVLAIAALASASETALTSVPQYRVRIQAAQGDERAQLRQIPAVRGTAPGTAGFDPYGSFREQSRTRSA